MFFLTEFDEKGYEQTIREEGYEDGMAEGIKQERERTDAERDRADKAEAMVLQLQEEISRLKASQN